MEVKISIKLELKRRQSECAISNRRSCLNANLEGNAVLERGVASNTVLEWKHHVIPESLHTHLGLAIGYKMYFCCVMFAP